MNARKYVLLLLSVAVSVILVAESFSRIDLLPEWYSIFVVSWQHHLLIGKDVNLISGPLYFLLTEGGSPLVIFFDLFIVVIVAYIIYRVTSASTIFVAVRVGLVALIIVSIQGLALPVFLVWIVLFLLFDLIEGRNYLVLATATLLSIATLFIQANAGMVALAFLLVASILIPGKGKLNVMAFGVVLGAFLLLIFLISIPLHTDVVSYVVNGISLNAGFSDVMHPALEGEYALDLFAGLACIVTFVLSAVRQRSIIASERFYVFLYLSIFSYLFFLFKAGFASVEINHFFEFAVGTAALLVFFTRHDQQKEFYRLFMPVFLIAAVMIGRPAGVMEQVKGLLDSNGLQSRYTKKSDAGKDSTTIDSIRVLTALNGRSVDIVAPDIRFISLHSINYKPRPVVLPQFVNTSRLDRLNAGFIDKDGPELIVVDFKSALARYPLFDEPGVKIALLENYRVSNLSSGKDQVLLERRSAPSPRIVVAKDEALAHLSELIETEPLEQIQIVSPDIKYSLLGHIFKFFFWAPPLSIDLTLTDNSVSAFRYPETGQEGIIINKFIRPDDNDAFRIFMKYGGRLTPSVKAYRITSSSPWAFDDEFYVRSSVAEFGEFKTPIDDAYKPMLLSNGFSPGQAIATKSRIEEYTVDKSVIRLNVWAFAEDSAYRRLRVVPFFQSRTQTLIFPQAANYSRPDVAEMFGKAVPDNCGFTATIFKEVLSPEVYRIGVAFMDGEKVIKWGFMPGAFFDNRYSGSGITSSFVEDKKLLKNTTKEDTLLNNIEMVQTTEHAISIKGWVVPNGKSSNYADSVWVIARSADGRMFSSGTLTEFRSDVSAYLKNPLLDSAGFRGTILTDVMPRGNYDLGLYVKERGKKGGTYQYLRRVPIGFPEMFTLTPFLEKVNEEDLQSNIDTIEDNFKYFRVAGWALDTSGKLKNGTISIILEAENGDLLTASTNSVQRTDVAEHFKQYSDADQAGFETKILKKGLFKGKYRVGILIQGDNGDTKLSFTDHYVVK